MDALRRRVEELEFELVAKVLASIVVWFFLLLFLIRRLVLLSMPFVLLR
jgi:hypothetical protein